MAVNGHASPPDAPPPPQQQQPPSVNGLPGPGVERGAAGRAFLAGMLAPGPGPGLPASPSKGSPQASEHSPGTASQLGLSPSTGSAVSPLHRSPGAVRVVELPGTPALQRTSPNPSHISFVQTSPGSSCSGNSSGSSLQGAAGASGPHQATGVQPESTQPLASASQQRQQAMSFIQQRIERLYGPGALAQAFLASRSAPGPLRTPPRSLQQDFASSSPLPSAVTNGTSGPALPVLRHLRPEFRAQLPLAAACPSPRPLPRATSNDTTAVASATSRTTPAANSLDNSSAASPSGAKQIRGRPPPLEHQTSVESLSDQQPAAPEVPVPVPVPVEAQAASETPVPQSPLPTATQSSSEDKDGHYYLKVLKGETERLTALVEIAEAELEAGAEQLPEEALGWLRAAAGQARLLMKQKLQQFEGLCHKNLSQSTSEAFPTTAQDLAGFWDMVKLQVDHVDRLFEDIERRRQGGWAEQPADNTDGAYNDFANRPKSGSSNPRRRAGAAGNRGRGVPKTGASNDAAAAAAAAARKGRDEARRKMMEERRKAMRAQQQAMQQEQQQQQALQQQQQHVEIFVPQENGK